MPVLDICPQVLFFVLVFLFSLVIKFSVGLAGDYLIISGVEFSIQIKVHFSMKLIIPKLLKLILPFLVGFDGP